jgi:hypothetical protein
MAKTKYKNLRKQLIKWAKATSRILLVNMLEEKISPKINDTYWYVSDSGVIVYKKWKNDEYDQYRLKTNNVFKTEEEAKDRLNEIIKK